MIARGQDRALGGLRPEDWGILLPAQRGQLHGQVWPRNLLCRPSAQPERKSLSVSAPSSPPALGPHIPAERGGGQAATSDARPGEFYWAGQRDEQSETGALQRLQEARRGSARAPSPTPLRGGTCERRACAQREAAAPAPDEGQDGGREGTRRRTVADEVGHGAPGALRVGPPGNAGAIGSAEIPALGSGGLYAGGLPRQGALPAARELSQQQAQRPQRVFCQSGLGLDFLPPPAFHCPHQLPPDGQGRPGPAAAEHPARGHGHLVRLHGHLLQHRALHGQLLPVASPGGGAKGAPEQAAVPRGGGLLARLRHLRPLLPADLLRPHDCGGDGRAARGEDGPEPPSPHSHHHPGGGPGLPDLHLGVDVSVYSHLLPQLVPESVWHPVRSAGLVRDVRLLVSEILFSRTPSPELQFEFEARHLQEIKEKQKG